jgi:hypothetical protein
MVGGSASANVSVSSNGSGLQRSGEIDQHHVLTTGEHDRLTGQRSTADTCRIVIIARNPRPVPCRGARAVAGVESTASCLSHGLVQRDRRHIGRHGDTDKLIVAALSIVT